MLPRGYWACILGPKLVALMWKVLEPLRGGILLKEVCHWAWRLFSLASLPVLLFLTADALWERK